MGDIADNIADLKNRIRIAAEKSGREANSVRLVAVSKTMPGELVRQAAEAGQTVFGENYIQEAQAKMAELAPLNLEWHFIGHLQSNKAKEVIQGYSLIHSVDRLKLVNRLDRLAGEAGTRLPVLIQANLSGEATKGGSDWQGSLDLARRAAECGNLEPRGLMTMPPFFDQPDRARPFFRQLRELAEAVRQATGLAWPELSMGMTGDFEVAIEEGATLVRIGTAIFGPRNYS